MQKVAVINVVGLTQSLIGENTPFLHQWQQSKKTAFIIGNTPAVTCTSQSNYLTGKWPSQHGIVANGWYSRIDCEIKFWKQSNKLVQSPKIWDAAKKLNKEFTCANLFWWFNMYSTVDYSVTPRPIYCADGLKLPDCYSWPYHLRTDLQQKLGTFPLFKFWGPMTTIESSRWIANAAMHVFSQYQPTLNLVYLPHLDYNIQRYGPCSKRIHTDLKQVDEICRNLIQFYESQNVAVTVLSEYGITKVDHAIHLNRLFRKQRWLTIKDELGLEKLDCGASSVFAVADHQIAHIYINDPSLISAVTTFIKNVNGIKHVFNPQEQPEYHLDHENSGDLIAVADSNAWFSYYYWWDDNKAPDFAKTVDIHRKPGYDPVELFMIPGFATKLKVIKNLIKKKLGFRYLLDVIPLDDSLVKGAHGAAVANLNEGPLIIGNSNKISSHTCLKAIDVFEILLEQLQLER